MSITSQRPNVMIIVTHDTGRHISPYGIDTVITPAFERMAGESVRFSQAFATASQGSPARAALFSGRYPHSVGVMGNVGAGQGWDFPEHERHGAQIFGSEGYQTWLLGLCQETHMPETLGFDEIDFEPSITDIPALLRNRLKARQHDRPFYCQIGCHETHRPFTHFDTPAAAGEGIHLPGYLQAGQETRRDLAEFQGCIKRLDDGLGEVMAVLEDFELTENTILVVTSDHGIAFPRAKCTLYDSGLEVFLFMRFPGGGWRAGTVRSELVSHVDILPTLLEACWIDVPTEMEGQSVFSLLVGSSKGARECVFAEKTFSSFYDPLRAVRTERYKYIRNFEFSRQTEESPDVINSGAARELGTRYAGGHPGEELYDLAEDPGETDNRAHEPGYEDIRANMAMRLVTWMNETTDPLMLGPVASPFYRSTCEELFADRI